MGAPTTASSSAHAQHQQQQQQRQRSRTVGTRPHSSVMMLSNFDRRLSLGEPQQQFARHLPWSKLHDSSAPSSSVGSSPRTTAPRDGGADAADVQAHKRKRLALELYETEHAYVGVLTHIDTVYYTPLLASLQNAQPILSRTTLNKIFANFYDILQLSKELLFRLEERIGRPVTLVSRANAEAPPEALASEWDPVHDSIGDLLVPILPFLKMYSLYMQNFSQSMQCIELERRNNDRFRAFLANAHHQHDHSSAHSLSLGLEAQLLNIVQRVPRYRLLLRSLLQTTPRVHPDHAWLCESFAVVDHIASCVNEHVRQHELTLAAIALQRTLLGLDEPLVVPGRRLLKYGTLLKTCRKDIQPRRFYLFSDCLLVAAGAAGLHSPVPDETESPRTSFDLPRPLDGPAASDLFGWSSGILHLTNKLCLSDVTVVNFDDWTMPTSDGVPTSQSTPNLSAISAAERPAPLLRHKFEILSPQCSFSVYASTKAAKDKWVRAIRDAQDEFRTSLPSIRKSTEMERPLSMASVSSEGAHIPTPPDGDAAASDTSTSSVGHNRSRSMSALFAPPTTLPILEDYHAPVWVPDNFVSRCKRCQDVFSFWRRKHHCRLCGCVFCASCCSGLFLLRTPQARVPFVRARACVSCYTSNFQPSMPCSPHRPSTCDAPLPESPPSHQALDTSSISSLSPLPSPSRRSMSLRPVLHTLPETTQAPPSPSPSPSTLPAELALPAALEPSAMPAAASPRSVLQSLTNTHVVRKRPTHRRRQWSIVSIAQEDALENSPRVQVETKTTGLPTLDQHSTGMGMTPSASMPALSAHTPSSRLRRAASRESLRRSQAMSWLQSMLRS